jgi:hypothetical protein
LIILALDDIKFDGAAGIVEQGWMAKAEANRVFNTLALSIGDEWVMPLCLRSGMV